MDTGANFVRAVLQIECSVSFPCMAGKKERDIPDAKGLFHNQLTNTTICVLCTNSFCTTGIAIHTFISSSLLIVLSSQYSPKAERVFPHVHQSDS